jgi:hypothetical protein
MKDTNSKWRWRKGAVDPKSEHFELSSGDKNTPVARIAPPVDHMFNVEFLIDETTFNMPMIKAVKKEIGLHLVEKGEPDPWKYAKHHCTTSSNRFSMVLWTYYPDGKGVPATNP